MKTLVTLSFALDLEDNDLPAFVRQLDENVYTSIRDAIESGGVDVTTLGDEIEAAIDFYGVSLTPRRNILEGIA